MEKTEVKQDNIGLFKLVSGEEVVAEYINESSGWFTLKKVRAILLGRNPKGQLSLQLGPWILSEQDSVYDIPKEHILTYRLQISPQLIEAYLNNVHSVDVQTNASKLLT